LNQRINPFNQSENLVNIFTGQVATSDEVLEAKERGLKALALAEEEKAFKVQPVHLKPFERIKKKTPPSRKERKLHMRALLHVASALLQISATRRKLKPSVMNGPSTH
jgi:hypothetical protein